MPIYSVAKCGRPGMAPPPRLFYRRFLDFSGGSYLPAAGVVRPRGVDALRSCRRNFSSCPGLIWPMDVVAKCASTGRPPRPHPEIGRFYPQRETFSAIGRSGRPRSLPVIPAGRRSENAGLEAMKKSALAADERRSILDGDKLTPRTLQNMTALITATNAGSQ